MSAAEWSKREFCANRLSAIIFSFKIYPIQINKGVAIAEFASSLG
jgi:hypothetical protein